MKLGRQQVFRQIDPPAGGLAGLRAKLDTEQRHGRTTRWWLVGSATAAVVLVGMLVRFGPSLVYPSSERRESYEAVLPGVAQMGPALASIGLAQPATEPVSVSAGERAGTAVQRVPLATDEVVFYWVATNFEVE